MSMEFGNRHRHQLKYSARWIPSHSKSFMTLEGMGLIHHSSSQCFLVITMRKPLWSTKEINTQYIGHISDEMI